MSERLLNMLGLMRKAGAIDIGETNTGGACRGGKAKLLLLASDASPNAQSRAAGFTRGRNVCTATLPFTKEEISAHVGVNGCSMAAITDIGFANAFAAALSQEYPGKSSKSVSPPFNGQNTAFARGRTEKSSFF